MSFRSQSRAISSRLAAGGRGGDARGRPFAAGRVPDVLAMLTALTGAGICGFLAVESERHGVLTYWFGGWTPRPGVVLGVAFGVDPASASIASFIGLLFAAALVFAWGYFDEVHAHFHVLMLLFLAAMVGFCLTRDLFNLFVWFEVMSVAAFALTAYRLEMPSLTGALNFTVANSIASFMMLGGVGLIYARAGVLDFEALGHAVGRVGPDPVLIGAFCLLSAALMIEAAILPFHFWFVGRARGCPEPGFGDFLRGDGQPRPVWFGQADAAGICQFGTGSLLGAGSVLCPRRRHRNRRGADDPIAAASQAHAGVFHDQPSRDYADRARRTFRDRARRPPGLSRGPWIGEGRAVYAGRRPNGRMR